MFLNFGRIEFTKHSQNGACYNITYHGYVSRKRVNRQVKRNRISYNRHCMYEWSEILLNQVLLSQGKF